MEHAPVYILESLRSPIGKMLKGLKSVLPADLASAVLRDGLKRGGIPPEQVQEVVVGTAVSAGMGQNLPRAIALAAGVPVTVPAYVVGNVCASGLQAFLNIIQTLGTTPLLLAAAVAVESASRNPELVTWEGTRLSSLQVDGLQCSLTGRVMGDLCEDLARTHKISREAQDQYAFMSHSRAVRAQRQGAFDRELVPVPLGADNILAQDECPRPTISVERLSQLPPAFQRDGTITAGNASAPADGACVVLAASETYVKTSPRPPLAAVWGYAGVYVPPRDVFGAAGEAVRQCCRQCRWRIEEVDAFEICEAFSAVALIAQAQLGIPDEKLNINGGDIALGHPLGAAGLRCLVTLTHVLEQRGQKKGIVCACFGGGGAIALGIERI
ncbi:MAG: thiolase family protein [Candidatus Omnitrophota bacterium]|jgi:acetyl-CoA C-acetyltransferase